jgi:PAS domain S-box-containing protein
MLFEQAPIGLAQVALDGQWLRVNSKLCEFSGYRRDELLRLTYLDLTPPEDLEDSLERLGRLLRGEIGPYTVERRYVRKDGRRVWVRLKVSLARGASGEPGYFACTAEDITGRKLEEIVPDPLTDRELEVLLRVTAGRSDPQVAEDLCYSLGTVKRDLRSVFCKLGVRDRRGASERAVSIGLIAPQAPTGATSGTRRFNF